MAKLSLLCPFRMACNRCTSIASLHSHRKSSAESRSTPPRCFREATRQRMECESRVNNFGFTAKKGRQRQVAVMLTPSSAPSCAFAGLSRLHARVLSESGERETNSCFIKIPEFRVISNTVLLSRLPPHLRVLKSVF